MSELTSYSDDLLILLDLLPDPFSRFITQHPSCDQLTEIVMDLGCHAELRFSTTIESLERLPAVTHHDLHYICEHIGSFNTDNRAGIERTLHRISAIRNRAGDVIGLTCRIGRAIEGTIAPLRDLVESPKNLLFLGPPGSGKTTKLRETARILSVELNKRVIVVDTSNEIAGDGDIAHPGIGRARRMQVPSPDLQHAVMIEAVENHMPEVIIVDEIGTEAEALAARTIAERGVQLVATAHGNTIENLLKNPTLSDLLGGIQSVILGDEQAKFRGTQKTVLERKSYPTFSCLVEIQAPDQFAIYHDTQEAVDHLLRHDQISPEIRRRTADGTIERTPPEMPAMTAIEDEPELALYLFGIPISMVNRCIRELGVAVQVVSHLSDADLILTTQSQAKHKSKLQQILSGRTIPIHRLKDGSAGQVMTFLSRRFGLAEDEQLVEDDVMSEIYALCKKVKSEKIMVDAMPQRSYYRRLQHKIVEQEGLRSISVGTEPNRRLRIYP